jgi:Raf kinase inhibitor-like YbhB/YbcL family protein
MGLIGAAVVTTLFQLTSPAFESMATIPKKYTCDGKDVSPPLEWKNAPAGTVGIAVIMEDPDAPAGVWTHWVIYDAPSDKGILAEGLPRTPSLADGAKQGSSWGVHDFESVGYRGPCPPPGKPHRYVFRAYALGSRTGLVPRATKDQLLAAIEGHVLARAELVGLYGR